MYARVHRIFFWFCYDTDTNKNNSNLVKSNSISIWNRSISNKLLITQQQQQEEKKWIFLRVSFYSNFWCFGCAVQRNRQAEKETEREKNNRTLC